MTAPAKPISIKKAMELLDCTRVTLDAKIKKGVFTKYYLDGKPYLDEEEIKSKFTTVK